ncbi:MAG TPA: signal peptidase II [Candidatus Acidoferrum sp.]|nr:signal peptidase II [Candidatus Acidoferrum sp.]
MELAGPSVKKVNAVSRRVPIAAISTALVGIAVEITTHLLVAGKRAIWLFKPNLYVALPKPFVHTDWLSVAISVAASLMLLYWMLFRKAPSKPALPLMWLGLGMILGGAVGETVTGIALGTITSILVVTRGTWGYAFGPFDVAKVIGIVLFLPGFLRDTTETYGWRELLGRGRTLSDPRG